MIYSCIAIRRPAGIVNAVIAIVIAASGAPTAVAESTLGTPLSEPQLLNAFANVRDDAAVQDVLQTRAINLWFADGRFISHWKNSQHAGEVHGSWRVKGGRRCITIISGLTDREGDERCSPIYQRGDEYISVNADGTVHGIHKLSPMPRTLQSPGEFQ